MAGICTSSYPSSYIIEKVGDSPYPYPYPINVGFPVKTGTDSRVIIGEDRDEK